MRIEAEVVEAVAEPLRLRGYAAIGVGSVLMAAIGWSMDMTSQQIVGQVATALLSTVGGVEWARRHVSPAAE